MMPINKAPVHVESSGESDCSHDSKRSIFSWPIPLAKLRCDRIRAVSPEFQLGEGHTFKLVLQESDPEVVSGSSRSPPRSQCLSLKHICGPEGCPAPTIAFRAFVDQDGGRKASFGQVTHDFASCVTHTRSLQGIDLSSVATAASSCCSITVEAVSCLEVEPLPSNSRNFAVFKRVVRPDGLCDLKRLADYTEELDTNMANAFASGEHTWTYNYKCPGKTKRHYTVNFDTMVWKRSHHSEEGTIVLQSQSLVELREFAIARKPSASTESVIEHFEDAKGIQMSRSAPEAGPSSPKLQSLTIPSHPPGFWLPRRVNFRPPPGLEDQAPALESFQAPALKSFDLGPPPGLEDQMFPQYVILEQ